MQSDGGRAMPIAIAATAVNHQEWISWSRFSSACCRRWSRRFSCCAGHPALSQGSGSSRLSPPRQARPQTPAEFQQSFWKHITVAPPYREWTHWPAGAEDARSAKEPHGPWVKTYANPAAAKTASRLEYGSILVNEEYDDNKTTLKAVSVMYCVKGSDPAHYDWYWLKYTPDGKVIMAPAGQGGKPIAGKVQSCINCHQKARADLVFSSHGDPRLTPAGRLEKAPSRPRNKRAS